MNVQFYWVGGKVPGWPWIFTESTSIRPPRKWLQWQYDDDDDDGDNDDGDNDDHHDDDKEINGDDGDNMGTVTYI